VIAIVHHADYAAPASADGRRRGNKNSLVRELLEASGAAIEWIEPEPMPRGWIEAVHDPGYVEEVANARVPAAKERRIGFAVTETVSRRAFRVPGGTWTAALAALERGFAANNAGGSHHALHDSGAGYCVFNDLAIVANRLVAEGRAERVLVIDVDVHQGDGTAALTAGRPGIATYSIHAEKNFPVRKARSTVDVALPDGTGDEAYLAALHASLVPLVERFRPTFLLCQAGVDPFGGDRLGRLSLSQAGLDARDRFVAALARERDLPLASTLGGGYGEDAGEVAARHARTLLNLSTASRCPRAANFSLGASALTD
jgi:acetoin utilization deacetylase AcuC-like enzyme